jgi:DNA-binding transcriptional LysR family regulator
VCTRFNVGTNQTTAENFVAEACVSLSTETSRVTLKITDTGAAALTSALHKGEMDFCVSNPHGFFSPAEFVCERLFETHGVVIASDTHRLAKRKQLSLVDLAGDRWASHYNTRDPSWLSWSREFEKNGLPMPSPALETNSMAVKFAAIAYSNYLGLATREVLRQEERRFPLVELPVKEILSTRGVSIIYRKGAYLSPAARRLIAILSPSLT